MSKGVGGGESSEGNQEQAPLLEKGCETVGLYPLQHS